MRTVEVVKKEYQTVVVDTINELATVALAEDVIYDKAGVPESVQDALDELFSDKHTHANKAILDAIEQPYTTAERDKLASFSDEAEYVEVTRNIFTTEGISGGGTLGSDRLIKLDLGSLTEDTRPELSPLEDFIATVDSSGVQRKTAIGLIPHPAASRLIAYVTPPITNSPLYFNVAESITVPEPPANLIITQGTAPVVEDGGFTQVDGYTFVVRLPEEMKNTGFLSEITGTPNLVFDEDQFVWASARNRWVQLETGDAVISVHGRNGNIVSMVGDYNAQQILLLDGLGNPTAVTVQSELEVKVSDNTNETITGEWLFRTNFVLEAKNPLPASPKDGQVAYYDNGVDAKYLVIYKVLSTLPTAGTDGWYRISDDTLVV